MLSKRATLAQKPSLPYFSLFLDALSDLHDPILNPSGKVSLCVAENALSSAAFASRLSAAAATPAPPGQLGYCNMRGRDGLRAAISCLAEAHITRGAPVDARHLTVGGGCGSLIQHLAFLLCDAPTDCMLLVTPTYAMLYNDVSVLAGVCVVDVPVEPGAALTPAALDAACARAAEQGLTPRLLFLISPDNPLGVLRPEAELREALSWARARPGLHVVVDEIYALSVFGGAAAPFHSAAALLRADAPPGVELYLGDAVHILWGFSKDFCASGLRVGCLFSHNVALAAALDNVSYFSAASNATQDALAEVLRDEEWVTRFLEGNRRALAGAAAAAGAALAAAGVPFLPPTAGMFLWVDLRALLPAVGGWVAERELTRELFADAGVLLTPGEAMHAPAPGFYRLCFAWHPDPRSLEEGLRRLAAFVGKRRAQTGRAV
jgi:1-aminocyclopropane-1-carboxylate synthase